MLTLCAFKYFIFVHIGIKYSKMYSQPHTPFPQQSVVSRHTRPLSLPVTFSQDEPIDDAFTKLSAYVTNLIQFSNFPSLQRACIEKAKSPKMLLKSNEIIPVIKEAQSFQSLCSMLANTSYWNFLDTRMMESMAIASRIPYAQEAIKNFKQTYFNMTLREVAPHFVLKKRIQVGYTSIFEDLDRDMTIGELHNHRFYLENKIIQVGPDTITICNIIIGSVKIIWQIHVEHAYQAFCRLKQFHSQLKLKGIRSMSVPEMKQWEGLPVLYPGQDMTEVGPIESSACVRHEPYPLPEGFEWCIINDSNFDEITQDASMTSRNFLKWWFISCSRDKVRYLLGIRLSQSKNLAFLLICIPCNIMVGGKLLPMVNLQQAVKIGPHTGEQLMKLYNAGIKEAMRILRSDGIFQATMFFNHCIIPKPIITFDVYFWDSSLQSLPYTTPRTVGLRKIKQSDVPKALALTNQYTSRFKIRQVFQSEDEFSQWFLNPIVDTYVIEEPKSGNITDLFSFKICKFQSTIVLTEVIALVITSSTAKEIITDLVVCAKQEIKTLLMLPRFGLEKDLFTSFSQRHSATEFIAQNHGCCLFLNYKYPEVDDDNHCLFGSRLHTGLEIK